MENADRNKDCNCARFEVFTVVKILGCDTLWFFSRIRLHSWRWRQHSPPNRWYPTATLYSITSQKNSTRF